MKIINILALLPFFLIAIPLALLYHVVTLSLGHWERKYVYNIRRKQMEEIERLRR